MRCSVPIDKRSDKNGFGMARRNRQKVLAKRRGR